MKRVDEMNPCSGRVDNPVYGFITAVLSGRRLTRFGDGSSTWRDYAHVDDVVAGLRAAMHRDEMARGGGGSTGGGGGGGVGDDVDEAGVDKGGGDDGDGGDGGDG